MSSLKKLFFTLLLSFCTSYVWPQSQKWKITISIEQFNHDYNWSIAGNINGGPPNILSELIWTGLKGPKFNASVSRLLFANLELGLSFSHHNTNQGKVKDTDYMSDDRTDPFFNRDNMASKGSANDYSIQLSYRFPLGTALNLKPYIGVAAIDRKLYILDPPGEKNNPPLNSSYNNHWKGGVLGTEISYTLKKILLSLNLEAGYYNYVAKARWNLNEMFQQPLSFKQTAKGYTLSAGITGSHPISKNFHALVGLEKEYGATRKGIDEAYLSEGSTVKTRFNGAGFNALGVKVGMVLIF